MAASGVGWPLDPAEWREHWEWCREYIDREVIYRVDETHPPIPSKKPGGTYVWQFYLRRATYNSEFAHRLGLLFWDHFGPIYKRAPFQICACWPSGAPIGMAIVLAAVDMGIVPAQAGINLFMARRTPKHVGIDNWFDGHVEPNLPVLMVDDAAASTEYMKVASARVQAKLRLPLHRCCFTLVNKVGFGFSKDAQHTENYLDNMLISFFNMNNFCHTVKQFRERYGENPKWTGIVQ